MHSRTIFAQRLGWALLSLSLAAPVVAATKDPLEPINRPIHGVNMFVDRILLRPVAVGYKTVVPQGARTSVNNFFVNLGTPATSVNQFLQGKPGKGFSDLGRFLVNSTIGIGGLFDPAAELGLQRHREDFGQTLGTWGVGTGAYVVLPLRGPSTVRDALAGLVDTAMNPVVYLEPGSTRTGLIALSVINVRTGFLGSESLLTGDKYLGFRDAYLQTRAFQVNDGEVDDDPFLDDFDDEDFEDF